jgi:hypothetical protein
MLPALAEPMPAAGEVDLASGSVSNGITLVKKDDAQVTLKVKGHLPFAIDAESMEMAQASGFLDFAIPKLAVKGLAEGTYEVALDDQSAGYYSSQELAAGVPLAAALSDAKRLAKLVQMKENNYFTAWREVRIPNPDDALTQEIVRTMMATDDALHAAIHALADRTPEMTVIVTQRPAGRNLALNKKFESSDINGNGWNRGLTDGSWVAGMGTTYATGSTPAFPKTVTIDLEQSQPVTAVIVGVPPFGSTKTVAVSLSDDKANFTDIGTHDFEQSREARFTYTCAPTKARYVRLTYAAQHPAVVTFPVEYAFTSEVEVYAKTGSN